MRTLLSRGLHSTARTALMGAMECKQDQAGLLWLAVRFPAHDRPFLIMVLVMLALLFLSAGRGVVGGWAYAGMTLSVSW